MKASTKSHTIYLEPEVQRALFKLRCALKAKSYSATVRYLLSGLGYLPRRQP